MNRPEMRKKPAAFAISQLPMRIRNVTVVHGIETRAMTVQPARHYYSEFSAPVTVVAATDDPLATPANIEDWLRWLPRAESKVHFISPENCDGRAIGHVGMFRRAHSSLWPELIRGVRG
ncbi:hypothetical protein [Burkholderia metallica]|uniref:hypothetical protein n=1 Tax=Burkholderia metallica TaxID=488729 RepID=UPI0020C6C7E2|nr:hypothetical protein [Burkholderia metallica]